MYCILEPEGHTVMKLAVGVDDHHYAIWPQ